MVESGSKGIEQEGISGCGCFNVGHYNRNRSVRVYFDREGEGELAVVGAKEASKKIMKGGSYVSSARVGGRGGSGGEETTVDTREGLPFQLPKGGSTHGHDLLSSSWLGLLLPLSARPLEAPSG